MNRPRDWKDLPEPNSGLGGRVVSWYREHGRQFPWRETRDPFRVLCTEIMLQRTRARQVARIYEEHIAKWRGPDDVLEMGRKGVEDLFSSLGLLWRAEYFWSLQQELRSQEDLTVPMEDEGLRSLPGVGPYVATATRIYAYGHAATAVDSNVLRILGRIYGVPFPDHARRSPRVLRWASDHCPGTGAQARAFNWGLVDLGSMICTPEEPDHAACPLRQGCWLAEDAGS